MSLDFTAPAFDPTQEVGEPMDDFPAVEPAWCILCGQGHNPNDPFCSDCLSLEEADLFASKAVELAQQESKLKAAIDRCKAAIKHRLPGPGTVYVGRYGQFECDWRCYDRSNLDIKRLRKEQPAVYDSFSTTQEVNALYISKIDT